MGLSLKAEFGPMDESFVQVEMAFLQCHEKKHFWRHTGKVRSGGKIHLGENRGWPLGSQSSISLCPVMENQCQKQGQCPEILCHIQA